MCTACCESTQIFTQDIGQAFENSRRGSCIRSTGNRDLDAGGERHKAQTNRGTGTNLRDEYSTIR